MINFKIKGDVLGGQQASLSLGNFLLGLRSDLITEYVFNRGSEGPKPKRVETLAKTFRPESIGSITITRKGDIYELVDGHTRTRALLRADEQGLIPPADKLKEISFLLIPTEQARVRYLDFNNNEPHKPKHYITNPDLPLGKLVREITEDEELIQLFHQQLARIIIIAKEEENADFEECAEIFEKLHKVNQRVIDINKFEIDYEEDLDNKSNAKEWLVNGLAIVVELRRHLEELIINSSNTDKKKKAKKMLKNGPFFAGCLIGAIATPHKERFVFSDLTPKETANRIFRRLDLIMPSGKLDLGRNIKIGAYELGKITKIIRKG